MQKLIAHELNSENKILRHEHKMNWTYDNSASLQFKNASCIRLGWIYTNWYEFLYVRTYFVVFVVRVNRN